jgi:hypothetical protein
LLKSSYALLNIVVSESSMKKIIFALLLVQHTVFGLCQQEELNKINILVSELQQRGSIKDINLILSEYDNGDINEVAVGVNYLNDTSQHWWAVGPEYKFGPSGQLVRFSRTNPTTHFLCDTLRVFKKNGTLRHQIVFPDTCVKMHISLTILNNNRDTLYSYYPNSVSVERYKYKGGKIRSLESRLRTIEPESVSLHGISRHYDYKRKIYKEMEYERGVKISEKEGKIGSK